MKKKLIAFSFVYFFALLLLLIHGFITNKNIPFFSFEYNYPSSNLRFQEGSELFLGDKVIGEFKSKDDFLGTIAIRFLTYDRISTDSFVFRLKKKKENNWYYQNVYKAKEFGGYPLFPFGFPIIHNAKDKDYYFELESLYGKSGKGVGISTVEPTFTTRHIFDKISLLNNKEELIRFVLKKSKKIVLEDNLFLYIVAYFLLLPIPFFITRLKIPRVPFYKVDVNPFMQGFKRNYKTQINLLTRVFFKVLILIFVILLFTKKVLAIFLKILYLFHQWLGKK